MRRLIAAVASCSIAAVAAADCTCIKLQPAETTHYGGNMEPVFVEKKAYRALRGAVFAPNETRVTGVLIEIFTHPEYLLSHAISSRGRPEQKRIAACRTGSKGEFCFTNIPDGRYELRSSKDTNKAWDVSRVYVIVDSTSGTQEELKIRMELGI